MAKRKTKKTKKVVKKKVSKRAKKAPGIDLNALVAEQEQITEQLIKLQKRRSEISNILADNLKKWTQAAEIEIPDQKGAKPQVGSKSSKIPREGTTGWYVVKYLQSTKTARTIEEIIAAIEKEDWQSESQDKYNLIQTHCLANKQWYSNEGGGKFTTKIKI
jgi:hypothetical protein